MLDFTSALYLGIEHASSEMPGWERLTLGKPAALEAPPGAADFEVELASLIGCERAILAPSTLHLFWDLFGILAAREIHIFLDAHAYAIAGWGVERACAMGARAECFAAHDPSALWVALRRAVGLPIVVTDGYCPGCGRASPIAEYLDCVSARGGLMVVDDTQALGILGPCGGGSLRHARMADSRVLMASSLAKGFGAPLAVLAGSDALVSEFEANSATRMYSSPPSVAAIAAAGRALAINRRCGDALRALLAENIRRLGKSGLLRPAALFPVQSVRLPDAARVHQRLLKCGVRTVLHKDAEENAARVTFVVTARHTREEIDYAAACLREIAADCRKEG